MESLTHLDPEPPRPRTLLTCTAETACPTAVAANDPKDAALMLADHIWSTHTPRTGSDPR